VPQLLTYRDTERLLARLQGMNLVLVGGQAVNFWAERFHQQEPALRQYAPFCSRDIDFLGDAKQTQMCGDLLRCRYNLEDPFAPGPSAGVVLFEDEDRITHPIDFLRAVYGLDTAEVLESSIPVDVLDEQGRVTNGSLRVMSPIWCLLSRVHNVVGLPSTYDNEHGLWQLKASLLSARVFLSLLLDEGLVRQALNSIERIHEFCYFHPHGRAIYRDKKIDPFDAVVPDPRLPQKFLEYRYPQLCRQLAERRNESVLRGG
jgi:hypothetical protein